MEIFDRSSFLGCVDAYYSNPSSTDVPFLCLLHLVFAVGLVLATPPQGTEEYVVIQHLRDSYGEDHPELFFRRAKDLADSVSGFENADFWSVQALILVSVYMLTRTQRNAAYTYHGKLLPPDGSGLP
jgi:hypothetical protein